MESGRGDELDEVEDKKIEAVRKKLKRIAICVSVLFIMLWIAAIVSSLLVPSSQIAESSPWISNVILGLIFNQVYLNK